MNKIKRIPYGKGDFEAVNAQNDYYVDKTMYIPKLEATPFVFLIRPRRFGKTLFLSTLQSYYDIAKADRFEEFYHDTWILEHPTDERAKYMVLTFNFSVVGKNKDLVQDDFNSYCVKEINAFAHRYENYLPRRLINLLEREQTAHGKLQLILAELKDNDVKIYLMIDEYDNFTNTILAEYGQDEYHRISRQDGYFKQFFTVLKGVASGSGSALARMFITGVSPITMDDVTSGFNIGSSISTNETYNEILGFSENDVSEIIDYYTSAGVFHLDKAECMQLMKEWYDNYQFAEFAENKLFNTDMILYFMKETYDKKRLPRDLIDENVRVDYGKLRHLVAVNNQLNGNFNELELILANGFTTATLKKSFPHRELTVRDNFISLLFYFGLLAIDGISRGEIRFVVPNKVIETFMNNFVTGGYADACKVNISMTRISRLIAAMAYDGEWKPCIEFIGETIRECMAVRDLIEGEKVVQALLIALFHAGRPFLIDAEKEANGGFIDISLAPFRALYPDMKYAYLIEMKYLKAEENWDDKLKEATVKDATEQLEQYAADQNRRKEWHLHPHGNITLKKLIIVFKGRELIHLSALPSDVPTKNHEQPGKTSVSR